MQLGTSNSINFHIFPVNQRTSEVYFQMLLSSPPQLVTGFFCLFTCLPGQHDSMRCKKTSWQISNLGSTTIELWSHWLAEDSVVLRCARTNLTYRNTFPTFALRRVSFLAETTERTAKIAIVFIVASSWISPGLWEFPKFPKLQGGTQNNFDYLSLGLETVFIFIIFLYIFL